MASPITSVSTAEQQHMLLLFLPIKKGTIPQALEGVNNLNSAAKNAAPGDIRASTGVHFAFFYGLPCGKTPGLPVPSFQTAADKDLLVVQAIYDADFAPYISAFVTVPAIAAGLNVVLHIMDETGIVPDTDPTSAKFILANGLVQNNADAFNCLLMRYNFADPTIPAAGSPIPGAKYIFNGTFPGLTVSKILNKYPDATSLWPIPKVDIDFEPSVAPICD